MGKVSEFLEKHFKHYNAREALSAAKGYCNHLDNGGKMFMTLAGAMSTGELGIILARMIREGKVHGISCTAANLEEDIFNLVEHNNYKPLPEYYCLSPQQELAIRDEGYNRVTDTAIPENVFRILQEEMVKLWNKAADEGKSYFPYEYMYQLIRSGVFEQHYQIPPENSWLLAACEMNIPVFVPGYEDSTLGNIFAAMVITGEVPHHNVIRTGTEQMQHLVEWYLETQKTSSIGFFQIGGGIAGDFAICAVPLIVQDLEIKDAKLWGYFAQITDATTSYGGYSGAVPNEKITWFKLAADAPKYNIQSDASIVAPLIFAYVLGD
ncbi:MAG: deoxyhypusine synthase family protein [Deltaproteobacteria bacterium]|nr:deoxyhypusine synthase family protein [Deltaproteobacteria bacterium]